MRALITLRYSWGQADAFGIEELHHTVGKVNSSPLPEQARARLHEFARLLDRLARRIDRVVLA
jgi:hypothetical protein